MTPRKTRTAAPGIAWAWKIQFDSGKWAVCDWAYNSREELLRERLPSPEAKPVQVRLTPVRSVLAAERAGKRRKR